MRTQIKRANVLDDKEGLCPQEIRLELVLEMVLDLDSEAKSILLGLLSGQNMAISISTTGLGNTRRIHRLKTWPVFYNQIEAGTKTFEVRRNDRDFQEGDILILDEWYATREFYAGRSQTFFATYALKAFPGIEADYIVMAIAPHSLDPGTVPLPEGYPKSEDLPM